MASIVFIWNSITCLLCLYVGVLVFSTLGEMVPIQQLPPWGSPARILYNKPHNQTIIVGFSLRYIWCMYYGI